MRYSVLDAFCGARGVQELDASLVEICVWAAEPRTLATHTSVCCCLGQVLLRAHLLDLLEDSVWPTQLRAGESEHQRGGWTVVGVRLPGSCGPEVAAAAHEHTVAGRVILLQTLVANTC